MLRKQSAIVLTFVVIGLFSLIYSSRVLADLADFSVLVPAKSLGVQLVLQPDQVFETEAELDLKLHSAREVITQRLEKLEVTSSYQVIVGDESLLVSLPVSENVPYITSIITHRGEIAFIDGGVDAAPVGQVVKIGPETNPEAGVYNALLTGDAIETIQPPDMAGGEIFYQLTIAPAAAPPIADFIENRPDHYLCIVIDQEVIGCSKMYHWSENNLEILPNLSSGSIISLADLALFLETGPLPLVLEVQ